MQRHSLSQKLAVILLTIVGCAGPLRAQIQGPVEAGERSYQMGGMTDQPFMIQVVGARRTVGNVLLIKLSLTNNGTGPIQPNQDFAGDDNPTDRNKISGLYAVDPNGRKKYTVLRDANNQPLCSTVAPPIKPGEQRMLYAQLAAPPTTTSTFDLFFPKTNNALTGVPIGLPQAGEPIIPGADVVDTTGLPTPPAAVPLQPSTSITEGANNNEPNLYTNQTNPVLPNSPSKGIGTVESANSTVPFTVDVLGLQDTKAGATLRLAMTNNGSGNLEAAGQFTTGVADTGDSQKISGVYLMDPISKQRFDVLRGAQGAEAAKIDPAFGPGERRVLEAHFPTIPDTVKSVYVYFPHATPISGVMVSR